MARTAATKLALVALVAAMLLVASDAITCGQVNSALGPCVAYAQGKSASPSGACCSGVRSLAGAAKTKADKIKACNCIKSAAGGITGGNAATIPQKCGVNIP